MKKMAEVFDLLKYKPKSQMTNREKEFTRAMQDKELMSFTEKIHQRKYQGMKAFIWKSGKDMTKEFNYKKSMAISVTKAN